MNLLSSLDRSEIIKNLSTNEFDLLIIGGGITGAGIALDAASRGMKVVLVEKNDFASGTSSKSTKLIHGGLRYLKQLEINLVREVGRERAIVHRMGPHLVSAEKMLLPLVKDGTYGEWGTSLGLWVYDVLAGVEGDDKRRMLTKEETLEKEPLLRADDLKGSGYYAEYRTDDARLTIANIKKACEFGALCINYVKAEDFIYGAEQVVGVACKDQINGQTFNVSCKFVVSAAGPWVDTLRKTDNSLKGKHLFLSKGAHIVVPHDRFPVKSAVYFDAPDDRMIFSIPRHRVTYIGTTDTPYDGDLNDVQVNQEDVDYLLAAVNAMFPTVKLTTADVESSWAGLRPLIHEEGKSASEMSRKDEIFESETGLISIAGGKLTGFRKMAARVTDLVADKYLNKYGKTFKENYSEKIALSGGPFLNAREVEAYTNELSFRISSLGLTNYHASYLISNYGRQAEEIIKKMKTFPDDPEIALIRAEAWFTINNELATTLLDFFNRRTGRLYFNLPSISPAIDPALADFKAALGWSEDRATAEKESLEKEVYDASHFAYSKQEEVNA